MITIVLWRQDGPDGTSLQVPLWSWVPCKCWIYESAHTNWASEASPTLGCSIEISCDIYIIYTYICMLVCMSTFVYRKPIQKNHAKMSGQNYVVQTLAGSKSVWEFETKCRLEPLILSSSGRLKPTCDTCIIHFYSMLEQF